MKVMPGDDEGELKRRRRLLGAALLEEAHRDERDDAGEQRGAEREPEQLHGLHQVAAGGLVVGHAVPLSSCAVVGDASAFCSAVGSIARASGASVVTGSGLRGENPAIPR